MDYTSETLDLICSEVPDTSALRGVEKIPETASFDIKENLEADLGERGIVIEGPRHPDIKGVDPNFWFHMMQATFCPKYSDCLMRPVPGFLPTVEATESGEVKSVTYTYVDEVIEAVTGGSDSDCWFDEDADDDTLLDAAADDNVVAADDVADAAAADDASSGI